MSVIGEFPDRQGNNFNLLRLLSSLAVLVSHSFPLSLGVTAKEPLTDQLGFGLGMLAVLTFFIISGFFISQSCVNSKNALDFLVARALRIYPALAVTLLLTILVLGPIATTNTLTDYFSNGSTYFYFFRNMSLKWLQYGLSGVFDHNPHPSAINGSLWTLFYEALCYAMVGLVAAIGIYRDKLRSTAFFVAYAIFYAIVKYLDLKFSVLSYSVILRHVHELTLPFVLGMLGFCLRDHILVRGIYCLVGAALAAACYKTIIFHEVFLSFWTYTILYLGFSALPSLRVYNRVGDYSYGVYIYAFPIEQLAVFFIPEASPTAIILVSTPIVLALSVASWHIVERHALRARKAVLNWLVTADR